MDAKIREMLYKVKNSAVDAGKAASKAAGSVVEQAKLNLRIFDLNTEIDVSYKEIGKLVYSVHKGEEVCSEAIQTLIEAIDAKNAEIKTIREKLDAGKTSALTCPKCGRTVGAQDAYCSGCGHKFEAECCCEDVKKDCCTEEACEEAAVCEEACSCEETPACDCCEKQDNE